MRRKDTSPAEQRRRTRREPPDLEEAVTAAQGLSDRVESQIEIAARLMGVSEEDVRSIVVMRAQTPRSRPSPPSPSVVVERRRRRIITK
jgi:hypothetical protein